MQPKPKASRPKRALNPQTTRSTGGLGFDFEDRIGAWLLKMLSGEQLPGVDVGITGNRLQTQTAALGWKIDDLLVTCGAPAAECKIAISCKANQQVSAAGFPRDFVTTASEPTPSQYAESNNTSTTAS
jgi:hypothetical protein